MAKASTPYSSLQEVFWGVWSLQITVFVNLLRPTDSALSPYIEGLAVTPYSSSYPCMFFYHNIPPVLGCSVQGTLQEQLSLPDPASQLAPVDRSSVTLFALCKYSAKFSRPRKLAGGLFVFEQGRLQWLV